MDSLLKKVNLDLRMRMYGVLATRAKIGIMEFVDHSMPVQLILDTYGTIRQYLASKNPDPSGVGGINPLVCIDICLGMPLNLYPTSHDANFLTFSPTYLPPTISYQLP